MDFSWHFLGVQKGHHAFMSTHKCFKHMDIIMLEFWKWHGYGEIQPTENLHHALGTFKYRKVIMHESLRGPPINMSSCFNVENWAKDEVVWWRRNWTNGKWKIGGDHYEKMVKWLSFYEKLSYNKIPKYQSLILCFPECQHKWNIDVGHYQKMEKIAAILQKIVVQQNSQLPSSPKFGLHFSQVLTEMEYLLSTIMKKWPPFHGKSSYSKIPNYQPLFCKK